MIGDTNTVNVQLIPTPVKWVSTNTSQSAQPISDEDNVWINTEDGTTIASE